MLQYFPFAFRCIEGIPNFEGGEPGEKDFSGFGAYLRCRRFLDGRLYLKYNKGINYQTHQGDVNGSITMEDAIIKANAAASNERYDFSQLPLRETKANLVYSEEDNTYEWVAIYIV